MPVACPSCKKPLNLGPQHAGKTIKCPHCASVFKVPGVPGQASSQPGAGSASTTAAAGTTTASSKVIVVDCSACGAKLKAPIAAAGKAVRCQCGQAVKVPATSGGAPSQPVPATNTAVPQLNFTAGGHSPLFNLSDAEWRASEPKKPVFVEEEKPKKKVNPYLANAAEELAKGGKARPEGAVEYLASSRNFLFGIGGFILAVAFGDYFISRGMVTVIANAAGEEAEEVASVLYLALNIFLGFNIFVAIMFMVLGSLIRVIPLAASIVATILYIVTELILTLVTILVNPFVLFDMWFWVIKIGKNVIIFGGLFQAINSANYYRYAKRLEEEERQANR
jgi:DNA-directed RNA polymerase subunit RPC12/RpoP